ncbi:aminotransferase class III-fold pyridoxal phosphate-dependent enzyme [Paraburkholderia sp. CNPSo 3157]|uniref:Aminotransferase class III-fold pyridoxal phosphate-dependent enzyme n=1 Tax=Paraburkholderia franconis TaxID=2654983 RepID=A0A7X1TIR3_9BURK|nr:aminotransferase class III-fold pyridoxal phosphate-dependent enzyme [Paraburkholderia franconis]
MAAAHRSRGGTADSTGRRKVHDTVVNSGAENAIEFFHGYTYTAHPAAAAAAIATLDIYKRDRLYERAKDLSGAFEDAVHELHGSAHVKDIRNLGLVAGVELESRAGAPGARAYEVFLKCFEAGVLVRYTGDILAFSPTLIVDEQKIGQIFSTVRDALRNVA